MLRFDRKNVELRLKSDRFFSAVSFYFTLSQFETSRDMVTHTLVTNHSPPFAAPNKSNLIKFLPKISIWSLIKEINNSIENHDH